MYKNGNVSVVYFCTIPISRYLLCIYIHIWNMCSVRRGHVLHLWLSLLKICCV